MISYYDYLNILELICFEGKLALVSENTPFSHSTIKTVSDIGLIDQFYIIDVRKNSNYYIHITSLDYLEFKKKFDIEKISDLLNKPIKVSILNISKNSSNKKAQLVKLIEEKLPCELIDYYISRFGLLLVFTKFDFENNLFFKKICEKCKSSDKYDIIPFSIKTKYEISGKTFIWIYYPEDLFLIHNKNQFSKFFSFLDSNLLYQPISDFRYKISTPSFEIFEKLRPKSLPSIYFLMNQDNFSINYYDEKKEELIQSDNFYKIYSEYIKMVNQLLKKELKNA